VVAGVVSFIFQSTECSPTTRACFRAACQLVLILWDPLKVCLVAVGHKSLHRPFSTLLLRARTKSGEPFILSDTLWILLGNVQDVQIE
jgi:hypothetical protein